MGNNDYLALGDSYTVGEGVAPAGHWPRRLVGALAGQGMALAVPQVVATTGWTTDELLAALPQQVFEPPYALVSLLIGVNNQYRGGELASYRAQFGELLGFAVDMAGQRPGRVLVVSIPDWGVTRFAAAEGRDARLVAHAIEAFNATAREQAAAAGCAFVDITGISRRCGDAPAMLAEDGLHPSAAQYALWLPPILAAARKCLA